MSATHVEPGEVLARLDPAEQQADVDAANAAVEAAEAQLRVARTTFDRQKTLIAQGFTTRVAFDQAEEGLRTRRGRRSKQRERSSEPRKTLSAIPNFAPAPRA